MKKLLTAFLTYLIISSISVASGNLWSDIIKNGEGKITFYWYPNNIRIDESKDIIDGVEHDLAISFVNYLNEKYEVTIELEWIQTKSFNEVMTTVRNSQSGVFGASSISITDERKTFLNFTPPYLSDVIVLVSSPEVPLAQTAGEFKEIFNDLTAISIKNTTLDQALTNLKVSENLDFNSEYVDNSGQIIDKIEDLENGFGYIDLPNFLVAFDQLSRVRRQFFYPIKMEGLGMIYSLKSDWTEPVNDYFKSDQFEKDKHRIIAKYFGEEVMEVVDRVAKSAEIGPLEEIVISTREKELQYQELLNAATKDKERIRVNNALFIGFIGLTFILLVLYIGYQIKSRANKKLEDHQDMIQQRNQQLQALNAEKNDLIKILAHDLRSPISNIAGCSTLLKKDKNIEGDSIKMVDFISQSSEKIEEMISKILDVDAIESGEHNLSLEKFDMVEVIKEVVDDNSPRAEKKKIKIECKIDRVLSVVADRFYSVQIIENLVSNAIKFSKENTKITISSYKNGNMITVAVKDEGPGLSENDKKKVFKKYQQLSASPTGGETTVGLGLSIVKLYAEMMKGNVSFESELSKGSTFCVNLPMDKI